MVPVMRLLTLYFVLMWMLAAVVEAVPLPVAALHPLMADLARQVGGDQVRVFDLVGEGGNPHRFEPKPEDLQKMHDSRLILAAGKNVETYLPRLRETMKGVPIVEVGRTIPSLTVGKDAVYACCPVHAAGALDPHWWHGVENMRRGARVVADALGEQDPANKAVYLERAATYGKRLGELKDWARRELGKIPQKQRKMVTAHNAFAYFAKEYGFEVIAVAGLTKEQNTAPQEMARTITAIKAAGVKTIFPEVDANRKSVEAISRETGVSIGGALIADGNGTGADAGFEGMIRHNARVLAASLAP